MRLEVERDLTPDNVILIISESETKWKGIEKYITMVMKLKYGYVGSASKNSRPGKE